MSDAKREEVSESLFEVPSYTPQGTFLFTTANPQAERNEFLRQCAAHAKNVYLSGTNKDVNRMNFLTVSRMGGESITYRAEDSLKEPDVYESHLDGMESLNASGGFKGVLPLKIGTLVNINANLTPGYMKGAPIHIFESAK